MKLTHDDLRHKPYKEYIDNDEFSRLPPGMFEVGEIENNSKSVSSLIIQIDIVSFKVL